MLSKFSVRKPFTVFVAVILIILLGVISFTRMSTDLLPKMTLPYAAVITTYPGASPEKVELSVTKPIEQTLATTSGVEQVTSVSSANTSMVILQFTQDTNMDSAMIEMSGSLDLVKGQLDDAVGSPMIMKIDPDMLPVMVASVDMEGQDSREITQLVEETVVPEFERISGVASVTATGLVEDSLRVTLNDEKIQALNDKVLASVDERLAEAEEKLDEGEAALKEARSQLENQQKEQLETLTEQNLQLSSALNQLNLVLSLLPEDTTALNDLYDSLESGKNDFSDMVDQIQSGMASVEDAIDVDTLRSVSSGLGTAADSLQALAGQLTQPELAQTVSDMEAALRSAKDSVDQAVELLENQPDLSQLDQLESSLNEGMESIKAAIDQLPQLRETISGQQEQLNEAKKQLDMGIQTLTQKMTEASVALTTQENELKKGREEFEASRDEAYEKAGLDGVITRDTISGLLTAQNFSMPAGYLSEGETQYTVRVGDALGSQKELEELVLFHVDTGDLGDITLQDVADVEMTDNSGEMYAKINGNDGILLSFQKQSTASTTEVSDAIRATMERLSAENEGLHITPMQDQGIYINIIIDSVLENLVMGGVLAVIILLLFLRSIRPTLVVALSIPISLTFALVLMYFSGVTLNIISLSGLALGVGMLVDNSIVVIENTYRLRAEGVPPAKAAMEGAGQVAGAIFSSTLTTVCVFLPIVFTEGMTRQLFTDMGLTIAYSLMASLLVALTLVPAMSSGLLRKVPESKDGLFARFAAFYGRLLEGALRFKPVVLGAVLLLFVFCLWQATLMGTAFMPETDSLQMSVSMEMPTEATTEETREMATEVSKRIQEIEGVDSVAAMESSGMMSMAGGGMSIYVTLEEERSKTSQQIGDEIEAATADLDCTVTASGSSMDLSALGGSGVQLIVKGPELDGLEALAADLGEMLEGIEGTTEIDNGLEETEPEIKVTVDKEKAMACQLTVAQVYQEVVKAISGETTATTLTVGSDDYPVLLVEGGDSVTHDTLKDYRISVTKDGEKTEIPLSEVAEISMENSLSSINHQDQTRTLTVSAGVDSSHNIGLVGRDVEKALASFDVPEGYTVELAGENETIQQTLNDMLLMILLAVVCIYLIMVAEFQSLLSPFIVMFTIPLAFTGGLLALLLTGTELSMIAMLGFLVLSGVVVNNGIVFVDYVNQLRLSGIDKYGALILAGKTRLRPILMTALTTILGLSTMALGMGSGADMVQPLAIVTIGGLLYATLLTLFVVPCLYDVFNRRPMKHRGEEEA